MNKTEFINFIAAKQGSTKVDAEKVIDTFTSSLISAIGAGNEISLIGFGNFSISKIAERSGRNPQTGAAITIPPYNQPKFKAGSKLKDACNK